MASSDFLSQIGSHSLIHIIQAGYDAVVMVDEHNIIREWNKSAKYYFGYEGEEVMGKPLSLIFKFKMEEEALLSTKQTADAIQTTHHICESLCKNGEEKTCQTTLLPLFSHNNIFLGHAIISKALSFQQELEELKAFYTDKHQALNKDKDEFLITASHELKTPITVLKWYMESMDLKPDASFRNLMKKRAMQQVEKLYTIVDELLDMAKLNDGKLLLKPVLFDIDELISESIYNMHLIFSQRQIIYEKHHVSNVQLLADKTRIEQVLINLLTNAIKYSPKQSEIYISLKEEKDSFIISVKDQGMGIPKKYQKDIFTKFFRIPGRDGKIAGMGIGLYVCSEIIKRHGGNIWLNCETENGCTFSFSIPKES